MDSCSLFSVNGVGVNRLLQFLVYLCSIVVVCGCSVRCSVSSLSVVLISCDSIISLSYELIR